MLKKSQEEGFEVEFETSENVYHGIWNNNFFFFEDSSFKFKIFINKKSFTLIQSKSAHIVCEYLKNHERFFFFDNSTNITSFYFSKQLMSILEEFFIDMDSSDFEKLEPKCEGLSNDERNFISKVLVSFDLQSVAYKIVANLRTKFELALELSLLSEAIDFCKDLKEPIYWKKLGDFAILNGDFDIAKEAYLSC